MAKILDSRLAYYCYLKFIKLFNDVEDNNFQKIKAVLYYEIKDINKNIISIKQKEIMIYEGSEFKDIDYIIDSLSLIILPEIISDKIDITGEFPLDEEDDEIKENV